MHSHDDVLVINLKGNDLPLILDLKALTRMEQATGKRFTQASAWNTCGWTEILKILHAMHLSASEVIPDVQAKTEDEISHLIAARDIQKVQTAVFEFATRVLTDEDEAEIKEDMEGEEGESPLAETVPA